MPRERKKRRHDDALPSASPSFIAFDPVTSVENRYGVGLRLVYALRLAVLFFWAASSENEALYGPDYRILILVELAAWPAETSVSTSRLCPGYAAVSIATNFPKDNSASKAVAAVIQE